MLKSGAPLMNSEICTIIFLFNSLGFTTELISNCYQASVQGIISNLRQYGSVLIITIILLCLNPSDGILSIGVFRSFIKEYSERKNSFSSGSAPDLGFRVLLLFSSFG